MGFFINNYMKKNNDEQNILSVYEKMYGSKNTPEQVNEALENAQSELPKRRRHRRGRNKQVSQTPTQENVVIEESKLTDNGQTSKNKGEINNMSKFDNLFKKVYNEQFEPAADVDVGLEFGGEEGLGGEEGMEGEDDVTLTIPRELAEKLSELLMGVLGGDEEGEEGEDEFGDEGMDDDFEEVEEGGFGESAMDNTEKFGEEKGKTLQNGNKVKAPGKGLGDAPNPQAGNRGASASQRPQNPTPAPKHHGG